MNVLLIESPWDSTFVDGSERKLPSLGMGYLCAALKRNGHTCQVVDGCGYSNNISHLKRVLSKYKKDNINLIGISATTDTFQKGIETARVAKKVFEGVPIVLGGCHVTVTGGDKILQRWPDVFDYIIESEGEIAFNEFIDTLIHKTNFSNVPGLTWRESGKTFRNDYKIIHDLDCVPFPDRLSIKAPRLHPIHEFGLDLNIITSRGCSHNCSFCSVTNFYKHTYRFRSEQNVFEEIEEMVSIYGDKFFLHFVDDNFFVNPKRASVIIEKTHKKFPNLFFSFATRSDQLLEGKVYLEKLRKCGCVSIELGIENGSQRVLDRFHKNVSVAENLLALDTLRYYDISPAVDYILFDQYTNIEDLFDNISFLKKGKLWGFYPPLIYSSLYLYPGTRSAEEWIENNGQSISIDKGEPCTFVTPCIEKIFLQISKFLPQQKRIFHLLEACNEISKNEKAGGISKTKIYGRRLQLMPYVLFEKFVVLAVQGWDDNVADRYIESMSSEINEIDDFLTKKTALII